MNTKVALQKILKSVLDKDSGGNKAKKSNGIDMSRKTIS